VPVTIVAHDAGGIGGMERQLEQLVLGLAALGHDVVVVARTCELPPHPRVRHVRVPGPARPFTLAFPWFFVFASILVRRHRRGVAHVTGAIVASRADVATVHLCHRALSTSMSAQRMRQRSPAYAGNAVIAHWLSRAAERWCYRPARLGAIVGVSRGVSAEIERYFPSLADRTTTVPNAVDDRAFHPAAPEVRARLRSDLALDRNALVGLFVGSEWEGKGLRFAIEGIARRPEWQLLVVGDGDRARYERLARSLGADDRVRLLPPTRDVSPFYQAADAFLLPSAYETFSLVSHEAAACGLPLLATRVSGIEDLLQDGVNGWFIRPDASDIAARLGALAGDPHRLAAMGVAAREAGTRHSWEATVDAYAALYQGFAGNQAFPMAEPAEASV
jgi:glycosyltransferase involved in cell wall biosynthesis